MAVFAGDHSSVAYALTDLADDTVGLLDALGPGRRPPRRRVDGRDDRPARRARAPERVRTPDLDHVDDRRPVGGRPDRGGARPCCWRRPPATATAPSSGSVDTYRVIGSPGFEFDEAALRDRAGLSFDRAYDPAGVARQLAAILTTPDRTADLQGRLPCRRLVIHGADDALVNVSGGRATAAAIPDAELLVVDGMGHDLPRAVWPQLIERMTALFARAPPDAGRLSWSASRPRPGASCRSRTRRRR